MTDTFILGDWGTSRLRLYRMGSGAVTARLDGPGIGALEASAESTLAERLDVWMHESAIADVTLCGMAGAAGALVEAGYAPCPADAARWLESCTRTTVSGIPVAVMPGLSCRTSNGIPEVMRGEETQLFGAMALHPELGEGEHLVALPGTHSKWARLVDGTVESFTTAPTGELFALLAGKSTLTGPDTPGNGTFDEGFARGLERNEEPLTAALFEARAARMLDGRSKDWSRGYLSGLLIGSEVAAQASAGMTITLIGDPALSALYQRALTARDCSVRLLDGDATVLAGLNLARGKIV
ncbi:2-dehydro-3-deoxygalactonokinase [Novosphingobium album (ex Hu et al. 2023)]|uniref:2-dehydro-3-deoxygalactonokinase n=1 Tax=Novosphingobium album (ex Hu et al. 2023) TaxID=2930093 RepID=A0ABT0B576_9SPHN|nr:2-dehydro-3-deoxygalactonokinase [Novosphingobium album (ex Hu et al. 2023)]MCJ2180215.1 2-dehydro-3-deoxygalactonokinase [Novosphingobium album (ex Hu et al. 2023)]